MALIGNLIKYDVTQSKTETETISITYPIFLTSEHPNYDLRGQTVQEDVPKTIEVQTQYSNVYVVVHSINTWKSKDQQGNKTLMNINYRAYDSKNSRDKDTELFLFEDNLIGQVVDYSLGKNEMQQAYDLVSNIKGFEQLTND